MSSAPLIIADPDDPTDDWAADHVRMLRELAELGMALARAVAGQALAQADGAEPGAVGGDPGLAFARVARSVRLTLALEARTREGVVSRRAPDISAFDVAGAAERVRAKLAAVLAPQPLGPREAEVRRVVEQVMEAEHPDADDLDDLTADVFERLERDVAYAGYPGRPIGATVARICRDLGVEPDWNRWAGEPWAIEEARTKAPGSPYASFPPPPAGESLPRARPGVARRVSAVTEGASAGGRQGPLSQPPDSG